MRLIEFKAKDVFGYLNMELSFEESPVILIGPNGSGKTTALRLIQALVAPSIHDLVRIPFSTASISFDEQGAARSIVARQVGGVLRLSVTGVNGELRVSLEALEAMESGLPEHRKVVESNRVLHIQFADNPVMQALSALSVPVFLGLDRRSGHSRGGYRSSDREFLNEDTAANLGYSRLNSVLGSGLRETQALVQRAYRRAVKVRDEHGERLKKKLLLTGFEYIEFQDNSAWEIIRPTSPAWDVSDLSQKREDLLSALSSIGLDPGEARKEIEPFFQKIMELGERMHKIHRDGDEMKEGQAILEAMVNRASLARLQTLIESVKEYNQKSLRLTRRFDSFISSMNRFFADSRKECELDPVGVVKIRRPGKVEIPVEALSSGERQLLIIFGHLYFNAFGERSNVFIIDEPELSLHLRWQENLLHEMISSNPRAQIIIATHSPEIVGDYRNNCITL